MMRSAGFCGLRGIGAAVRSPQQISIGCHTAYRQKSATRQKLKQTMRWLANESLLSVAGGFVVLVLASLCPVASMRAEAAEKVEVGAATSDPALPVKDCPFEHARYAPVEPQAGRHPALLELRAGETILGLAATLTTPQGVAIDLQFGFSNGYVRYYISADDLGLHSVVQGFKADMSWTRISSDDPAAAYLVMPDADFHARHKRPPGQGEAAFIIPDGLWRLVGCGR